jgi:hypothetical protein
MTETDIYKIVKSAILKTEPCPDGSGGMACASCLAAVVATTLAHQVAVLPF